MNQTDIVSSAAHAVEASKSLVGQQIDKQSTVLGNTLSQTARDLERISADLRSSGTIASAASVADWAAGYVDRAARYLANGDSDRFLSDLETLGRERPWAIAASAAALGFIAARVVKSSGARRYHATSYAGDYSYEDTFARTTPSAP
jgi:hypothetical protein